MFFMKRTTNQAVVPPGGKAGKRRQAEIGVIGDCFDFDPNIKNRKCLDFLKKIKND
jgi:hypothetical protein